MTALSMIRQMSGSYAPRAPKSAISAMKSWYLRSSAPVPPATGTACCPPLWWGAEGTAAAGRRASLGTMPTLCTAGLDALTGTGPVARRTDVGTRAVTVLSLSARGILTTVDAAAMVASFLAAPGGCAPGCGGSPAGNQPVILISLSQPKPDADSALYLNMRQSVFGVGRCCSTCKALLWSIWVMRK